MADEVKVRKADMINAYSSRYASFGASVRGNVQQIRAKLPLIGDHMSQSVNKMKVSEQSINHQKSNVENQLNSLMNQKEPDMNQVMALQAKLEKLKQLSKKAAQFVEQGKKLLNKGRTEIEDLDETTRRFGLNVEEKVAGGRNYLQDVASHITDYKGA